MNPEAPKELSLGELILGYLALLAGVIGMSIALESVTGVAGERWACILGGTLFIVASTNRWPYLFRLVRRFGWFAHIQEDGAMRLILAVLGGVVCFWGLRGLVR